VGQIQPPVFGSILSILALTLITRVSHSRRPSDQ
jgi:hypothetical protein